MRLRRRLLALTLALGLLLLLGGCRSQKSQRLPLPEGMEETAVIEQAIGIAEQLGKGEYDAVYAQLRPDVAKGLTVEDVAGLMPEKLGEWTGVTGSSASGQTDESTGEAYAVATLTCRFADGRCVVQIGIDTEGNLIGLRVQKS